VNLRKDHYHAIHIHIPFSNHRELNKYINNKTQNHNNTKTNLNKTKEKCSLTAALLSQT